MFKRVLNICYNASLLFILMFANLLILTSLLYFVKIPISVFHLPVSLAFAVFELYFIKKEDLKTILLSSIVFVIAFLSSCFICGHVYDGSADGNGYHKFSIGLLKNGWNPIYDSQDKFIKKLDLHSDENLWVEHYPKATWIYGASVYKLTNNIESAKSFNLLTLIIVFFIIAYLVNRYYDKKLSALFIALSCFLFPVMYEQIFCLYLDGFMGLILLLLVIYFWLFINDDKNKEYFLITSALLVIIINIKFTGLFYAGIFCGGYFIYYVIKKLKNKDYNSLLKTTISFVVVGLIAILIVGSNSYVKNTITKHNPLYPLFGEGKVDIITSQQPKSFASKTPIEKNFYSIFSYTANYATTFNPGTPELKIPFTANKELELSRITEDTRIGGFGIYFSGIFVISFIVVLIFLVLSFIKKEWDKMLFIGIPFIITLLLFCFFGESWWARYSPQTYFIVVMGIYILLLSNKKILYAFGIIILLLSFYNTMLIAEHMVNVKIPVSGQTRMNLEKVENKSINLEMIGYSGVLFNLKDHNINYNIKDKLENKVPLYVGKNYYEVGNKIK